MLPSAIMSAASRGASLLRRRQTSLLDGGQNLALVELRTEVGRCAACARLRALFGAVNRKGCTNGGPRVMRCGRDENLREGACLSHQLVGHAIERDAPGDAQAIGLDRSIEAPQERDDGLVGNRLQRRGKMHVPRQKLVVFFAARPEQGLEPRRIEGREAQRAKVDRVAVFTDLNDGRQLLPVDVRIAIGRKTHDLGGVVHGKTEVHARLLPQKAQGVRI
jgi:hypothetical protein